MKQPSTILLFLALFVVIAPAACRSTDPSPLPGLPDPVPAPFSDPQISVADPALQQWLGFQNATVVHNPNTPMTVAVPMRNLADDAYALDYRFLFFDELGRQLQPAMGWREVVVRPKAVQQLQASALDTRAQHWKLQVKWANR